MSPSHLDCDTSLGIDPSPSSSSVPAPPQPLLPASGGDHPLPRGTDHLQGNPQASLTMQLAHQET